MDVLLGFDPGGLERFGWCVASDAPRLPLRVVASGVSNDARSAIAGALAAVPAGATVLAAGIDAPLLWSRSGPRTVDQIVRAAIHVAGAPHAAGTVQEVNSLRGACLIQGVLAALELRDHLPSLPINESHPKALRWLYPEVCTLNAPTEHERDALLSAVSAWATAHHRTLPGWRDLYLQEGEAYSPVSQPRHYFMPIPF